MSKNINQYDKYRKKTFTTFWNNFNIKPKTSKSPSILIKLIKKFLKKNIGIKIKIDTYKNLEKKDEFFSSYQIDKNLIKYRNELLTKEVIKYLHKGGLTFKNKDINKYVDEYCKIFQKSPIKELGSGFGFNEGLFLYCIIKVINPNIVIESGIMKGFTTYLIDAAVDKNCKLKCYDISFENIEYKSKKADYFQHDINQNPPKLENKKVLAFWDDHTSQLDRLKFSIKNKIKFNFFDDDLSFLNFHSDGWPPIPTISMLFDLKKKLVTQNSFQWISRDRKGEIWMEEIKKNDDIKQIKTHNLFPNLFSITGFQNHSQCSFVILK